MVKKKMFVTCLYAYSCITKMNQFNACTHAKAVKLIGHLISCWIAYMLIDKWAVSNEPICFQYCYFIFLLKYTDTPISRYECNKILDNYRLSIEISIMYFYLYTFYNSFLIRKLKRLYWSFFKFTNVMFFIFFIFLIFIF